MKLVIPKGATGRIVTVFIQANNVTTGAGLGSLTNASGIVGGYVREGGTGVALVVDEDVTTEGTYQAPSAAGKVRIGTPANMRSGTYELHFHNDLWATGAETVTITLGGATNMADIALEVQLSDPAKSLGAPTNLDAAITSRMATYTQPTGFLSATFPAGTVANTTNITAGTITTVTNLTNAPTNGDLTTAMKASVNAEVDTALADYDGPTHTEMTAELATADDAVLAQVALVKAKTDLIPAAPAAVGDIPTAIQNADAVLDRDMATGVDSGSTTVRTPRQALRFLRNKWTIGGSTLTVMKENDSTASWTATVTGTAGADPITASDPAGP